MCSLQSGDGGTELLGEEIGLHGGMEDLHQALVGEEGLAHRLQGDQRFPGIAVGCYASGNYCLSSPSHEREAIQKTGSACPLGWFSSGSYCVNNH